MKNKFVCCICGKECEGYGNNPYPLKNEGRCCDECNKKVIEERLKIEEIERIINSW
jgi:hypothetical protein